MKFFKKSDIIIITAILVVALVFAFIYRTSNSDRSVNAEIYYESELVQTIDLEAGIEQIFSIPEDEHVIFHQYKDGAIAFEESDCPDKICVRAGKLSIVGESATCLPNRITLKIVPKDGYDDDDIDIIVGK